MEESEFKGHLTRKYDRNHSVRTNWEVLVLDELMEDSDDMEKKADEEYGFWFDEFVEELGEGKYV